MSQFVEIRHVADSFFQFVLQLRRVVVSDHNLRAWAGGAGS